MMLATNPDCAEISDRVTGDWTDFALCKGLTEVFFGPAGERPQTRERREALANSYCKLCPVSSICKATARENQEHGFWGGENDEERAGAGYAPKSPSRRTVIAARDRAERDAAVSSVAGPGEEDDFVVRRLDTERV